MLKYITAIFVLIVTVQSVQLPPNFHKCNRKDPNWKQCVLEAAQNGVSQLTKPFNELNLPSLDPLEIAEYSIIKKGQGKVAVDQYFTNCKFFGYNNIHFDQFEFDFDKKTLEVKGVFPELVQKSHYKMDGKILLLPIRGEGPSTIVLKNLKTVCRLNYEEFVKNGKTYIKFVNSELDIDPSLVTYNFENLFNGDGSLGDNVNQVLNENWNEVFTDVKSEYIEVVNKILINLMNNFFARVSIEEAFD